MVMVMLSSAVKCVNLMAIKFSVINMNKKNLNGLASLRINQEDMNTNVEVKHLILAHKTVLIGTMQAPVNG